MRFFKTTAVLPLLLAGGLAFAGEGAHATPSLLPRQFSGWQASASIGASTDPAAADAGNATLLREYGFTDFESATYARGDGQNLAIKAARFADTSGAYGAFTFYKLPQMLTEKIGAQGASWNQRVLFYKGNILVDAVFSKLTAMSAAELRELAGSLPGPAEGARGVPGLPTYLPRESYVKNSAKYVMGPVGLEKAQAPLPGQIVDFSTGTEVVVANYSSSGGQATLMLISYPTPQIAAEHLRRIDAAYQPNTSQTAGRPTVLDVGPIFDKRTGPIVVVASGPLSQSEAKSLLAAVNYEADVTWNENTYFTKRDNVGNLLVNIIILCGILIGFALVAGLAFGGLRILVSRLFPERIFDRPENVEFISLHLSEERSEASDSKVSPSIKAL